MATGRFLLTRHRKPFHLMEHDSKDSITPQWLAWVQHHSSDYPEWPDVCHGPIRHCTGTNRGGTSRQQSLPPVSRTPMSHIRAVRKKPATPRRRSTYVAPCFVTGAILLVKERSDGLWTLPGAGRMSTSPRVPLSSPASRQCRCCGSSNSHSILSGQQSLIEDAI